MYAPRDLPDAHVTLKSPTSKFKGGVWSLLQWVQWVQWVWSAEPVMDALPACIFEIVDVEGISLAA